MDLKLKYRMRVENCIGTIMDAHRIASSPDENETFLSQFEKLKKAVNDMDMSHISEHDVLMVEQATNALLGEFRDLLKMGDGGTAYPKAVH